MKKNQPRLGDGMAFFRPLDPVTLLGSGTYVRIARFEGATITIETTEVNYHGDSLFPISVDISEATISLSFEKMIWVIPDPADVNQSPKGNWSMFDMFGINYYYEYGAHDLDDKLTRSYLIGSSFADNIPEGQILLRAWGGPSKVTEWEFFRIRATKFSLTYTKTEYQTFSLNVPAMLNPAYMHPIYGPDGLVVAFRDFIDTITKLEQ